MKNQELRDNAIKLHQQGDLTKAKTYYAAYLALCPDDHLMWSNLGALFRSAKDFELAVAAHRKALNGPKNLQTYSNASNALFDAGYAAEAVKLREQALKLAPDDPSHHSMLAKFLRGAGKYQKAERVAKAALKNFPDDSELHIQLAMAQLSLGNYKDGFESFDWRWQGDEISPPEFKFPKWQGENLVGKTILVTPEQGFGDTILMARFLGQLASTGAEVLLVCKKPLERLFADLPGVTKLLMSNLEGYKPDFWAPMMDLPRYLSARLDTIIGPAHLSIPQDSVLRAQKLLEPHKNSLNIGVLWSGSVTYRANHKRSFDHRMFFKLADIPNLQMFSLYKGPLHSNFIDDGSNTIIVDAAGSDRDFADSAALVQELDIVVTMDSAIAHVAGSLGAETWNLLHSEAYWLYEPYKDHTPWYPSMRLIRQRKSGDWLQVFEKLHQDLSKRAAQKQKELS